MKNGVASDNWPACPVSRVRPMAPTAPIITYEPTRIQDGPRYMGGVSTAMAITVRITVRPTNVRSRNRAGLSRCENPGPPSRSSSVSARSSDTGSLPGAEQPGGGDDEHRQHDDEHGDLGEVVGDVLRAH